MNDVAAMSPAVPAFVVLAEWYAAHSAVRRLWAISESQRMRVIVTLEPTHDGAGIFYYWKGERPQLEGTAEIRIESADRAAGYWTTRSDTDPMVSARTSGVYLRANLEDMRILDGRDDRLRAELIAERLRHWKSITNA